MIDRILKKLKINSYPFTDKDRISVLYGFVMGLSTVNFNNPYELVVKLVTLNLIEFLPIFCKASNDKYLLLGFISAYFTSIVNFKKPVSLIFLLFPYVEKYHITRVVQLLLDNISSNRMYFDANWKEFCRLLKRNVDTSNINIIFQSDFLTSNDREFLIRLRTLCDECGISFTIPSKSIIYNKTQLLSIYHFSQEELVKIIEEGSSYHIANVLRMGCKIKIKDELVSKLLNSQNVLIRLLGAYLAGKRNLLLSCFRSLEDDNKGNFHVMFEALPKQDNNSRLLIFEQSNKETKKQILLNNVTPFSIFSYHEIGELLIEMFPLHSYMFSEWQKVFPKTFDDKNTIELCSQHLILAASVVPLEFVGVFRKICWRNCFLSQKVFDKIETILSQRDV